MTACVGGRSTGPAAAKHHLEAARPQRSNCRVRRADGRDHAGLAQRDKCNRQPSRRDSCRWPGGRSTAAANPESYQDSHSAEGGICTALISTAKGPSLPMRSCRRSERTKTSARCSACTGLVLTRWPSRPGVEIFILNRPTLSNLPGAVSMWPHLQSCNSSLSRWTAYHHH